MTDDELRQLAKDVHEIRNAQVRPARLGASCLIIVALCVVSFIVLTGAMGVIGRLFGW